MERQRYHIRKLQEVFAMAKHLGDYFDNTDDAITGIYELLMNAIEHGNLEIGYALKTELLATGTWEEEIMARQSSPRYARRYVEISATVEDEWSEITISDSGEGFDWARYAALGVDDTAGHGRGLAIAQRCGFVSLQFSARGNAVTCRGLCRQMPVWMPGHAVHANKHLSIM